MNLEGPTYLGGFMNPGSPMNLEGVLLNIGGTFSLKGHLNLSFMNLGVHMNI